MGNLENIFNSYEKPKRDCKQIISLEKEEFGKKNYILNTVKEYEYLCSS